MSVHGRHLLQFLYRRQDADRTVQTGDHSALIYIFIRQKAEETSEKKQQTHNNNKKKQKKHKKHKNTVKAGELVNTCLKN